MKIKLNKRVKQKRKIFKISSFYGRRRKNKLKWGILITRWIVSNHTKIKFLA